MRLRLSFVGFGLVVGFGALTWGCGSRTVPAAAPLPTASPPVSDVSPPPVPAPPPTLAERTPPPDDQTVDTTDCEVIAGAGERIATIALTDEVDPANAPRPTNDGERLLFRQLYETLVRVDCEGHLRPGLATSWRLDESRGVWLVTLRDESQFSDGTPVTATNVVSSWSRPAVEELLPQVGQHVAVVVPVDDRVLAITLRDGRETLEALAHTDLSVSRQTPGSRWPLGTRSAWVAEEGTQGAARSPVITLTAGAPNSQSFRTTADTSAVRFLVAPDRDPRDLLDEGVDLLVTRDAAALDYAATLPQFVSVPLAWGRTHVLLSPWRARLARLPFAEALQALADDAVRGEARGAEGPFWWQEPSSCDLPQARPPDANTRSTGRIVYLRGDAAARDLAERLIGLASSPTSDVADILGGLVSGRLGPTYERATALTGEELALALRRGTDAGYIVPLDRRQLDLCAELQGMVDRTRWLDPGTIAPLIDTRQRAVVRKGRSGMTVEWDGGLLLAQTAEER